MPLKNWTQERIDSDIIQTYNEISFVINPFGTELNKLRPTQIIDMPDSEFFLTSKRLGFSYWKTSDCGFARKLWTDKRVTKLISESGFSQEEAEKKLSKELEYQNLFGFQYFPISYLQTGNIIGCCGFHPVGKSRTRVELGSHLMPTYWGQGLALEAALTILEYAKEKLEIVSVMAGHNPNNKASSKILHRLGFKRVEDKFYQPTKLMHPTYELDLNTWSKPERNL